MQTDSFESVSLIFDFFNKRSHNVGKSKTFRAAAIAAVIAGPLTAAMATNGYFSHGYGMKAKGMGGASVAVTDSAFAGANNPAIAAWAGNRLEAGLDLFMPSPRGYSRTGSGGFGAGSIDAAQDSDSNLFYVPEFGYNRAISDRMGVGITIYGNGGLNTDYAGGKINCGAGAGTANALCGSGKMGVDMMQLVIAPTIAYKMNDAHSIGVSPLIVQQQFKADGVQAFDNAPGFPPMTGAPGKVTNNGYDSSNGVGLRLGYLGKLSQNLNVGVSYAPKISMSKFDKYKGLFADNGNFDIPENYTVGANYQASPTVAVALDYSFIKYSGVPSVGNPSTNAAALGSANGPGFGWADINVWKLGVQWQATQKFLMRAGVNVGDNPVKSRDVTFNILAPGVVTTHYTLGGTYAVSNETDVTFAYMYAPSNSVSGSSMFNNLAPGSGGTETIKMSEQSLGVQVGWHW
jgi:long-chain fatty acid transport protein